MIELTSFKIIRDVNIFRGVEPISLGLPLPKGRCFNEKDIALFSDNQWITSQKKVLNRWYDGSIRWLLLSFYVEFKSALEKDYQVIYDPENKKIHSYEKLINKAAVELIEYYNPFYGSHKKKGGSIPDIKIELKVGEERISPYLEVSKTETDGPIYKTLYYKGFFHGKDDKIRMNFISRFNFFYRIGLVKFDFQIHNPRRAVHKEGLWDLGDPNSIFFDDLSIIFEFNDQETCLNWSVDGGQSFREYTGSNHYIYQDSSGGEYWKNENHVNHKGEIPVRFRGAKIKYDKAEEYVNRPNPIYKIITEDYKVSMAVKNFWQNFPKAFVKENNKYSISLFPELFNDRFELQPGEKKLHSIYIQLYPGKGEEYDLSWIFNPAHIIIPAKWYEKCSVYPNFSAPTEKDDHKYLQIINQAIEGPNSFISKNEKADEFGWRNFGDIHADHETKFNDTNQDFPSHYNNQYDIVLGTILQFMRSGDKRWRDIFSNLAEHVSDIDVYHTLEDRWEFNGGMFWHTNHYMKAFTASHRCFSVKQKKYPDQNYGGGISLNQLFATGLIYYYYITGNPFILETITEINEYAKNQVEPPGYLNKLIKFLKLNIKTILRHLKREEIVFSLDGPGRPAANLLFHYVHAFNFTNDKVFLNLAEKLIKKTLLPRRNIEKLNLLDIERKWMYTMYLQAIIHYLWLKQSLNERDNFYFYVVDGLKKYITWMIKNEKPYLEFKEKLEYPDETWVAQDIRKAFVLYHGAEFIPEVLRLVSIKKAQEFYDYVVNYLSKDRNSIYLRPLAILLVNEINLFLGK